jgi:hypothetical protein
MIEISDSMSRRTALSRFASVGISSLVAVAGIASASKAVRADDFPQVVLEWLGAWNHNDGPRKIASLYVPDGTYGDVPTATDVQGTDIESYLKEMFATVDHFQRDLRNALVDGELAVAEQLFTAWTTPAYSPLFQVYAITLFKFEGEAIRWSSDYYDSGSILMQLGSIPAVTWFSSPYGPGAVDRFCTQSG